MKSPNKLLLAGVAIGLLAGCAPVQYAPIGKSLFGYQDRPNPDGGHTVLSVAPTIDMVREFWDRRAIELCPHGVLKKNIFRADRATLHTQYGDQPGHFIMEGYAYCKPSSEAS